MLFSVRLLLSSYIHNNNISSVQKCTKVGIYNPQPLNYIIIQSKVLSQMQGKQKKNPTKQTGGCFSWMDAYFWSGIFPSTKIHFQCHHTRFLSGRSWVVTVEEEREGARERERAVMLLRATPPHTFTHTLHATSDPQPLRVWICSQRARSVKMPSFSWLLALYLAALTGKKVPLYPLWLGSALCVKTFIEPLWRSIFLFVYSTETVKWRTAHM